MPGMSLEALTSSELPSFIVYDTISATSHHQPYGNSDLEAFYPVDNGESLEHGYVPAIGGSPQMEQLSNRNSSSSTAIQARKKRRRRPRSCKNKEEAESQRMTHITVERNRRRQMNEHLAVLRSLMPESYVQRVRFFSLKTILVGQSDNPKKCNFPWIPGPQAGDVTPGETKIYLRIFLSRVMFVLVQGDQASIVAGAIDFVKELEQLLQSLEAQKRTLQQQRRRICGVGSDADEGVSGEGDSAPFSQFFAYPQYIWCHGSRERSTSPAMTEGQRTPAGSVADIEVTLIETFASLRILSPRRTGQLLKMVAGFQALQLSVLHLSVTSLDTLVLYSVSAKVSLSPRVHHTYLFLRQVSLLVPARVFFSVFSACVFLRK